jgi:transmembrane sensor
MTPPNKFEDLLDRYLKGTTTPEETEMVNKWYAAMAKDSPGLRLDDLKEYALKQEYWDNIRPGTNVVPWRRIALIAASVSLLIVSLIFLMDEPNQRNYSNAYTNSDRHSFELINTDSKSKLFILPDSSRITLSPESSLKILEGFNTKDSRRVSLKGEAFFSISHNPEKPFYVAAGNLMTRVLGTSFKITCSADKEVTVTVSTGKVSVYPSKDNALGDESKKMIVLPDQMVVFNRQHSTLSKMEVKIPLLTTTKMTGKKKRFIDQPASQIFDSLSEMYSVDIQYDSTIYKKCKLTTSVHDGTIYKKLTVICDAIGARYEIEGGTIRIHGNGCN